MGAKEFGGRQMWNRNLVIKALLIDNTLTIASRCF